MAERTLTSVEVEDRKVFAMEEGYGSASSVSGNAAGYLHVAYGHYNFKSHNETVSASLVIQMVALPDQARIVDMWARFDFGGTGGYVIGDASLSNRFLSGSLSAALLFARLQAAGGINGLSGGPNYKVSLTASDANSYYPILLEINGVPTASASGCVAMAVYYLIDNVRT